MLQVRVQVRPGPQVVQPEVQAAQPVVRQEERPVVLLAARLGVRPAEQRVAQREQLEVQPQPVALRELWLEPLVQSLERLVWQVLWRLALLQLRQW